MKEILVSGLVALVDDEDFVKVSDFKWTLHSRGYATAYAGGGRRDQKYVLMHQLIVSSEADIDHRNGNKLDNRKQNLRPATRSQNNANRKAQPHSSKYKGVRWHRQNKKWTAQIGVDGKSKYLGSFVSEEEAAQVYDRAAIELYGAFAKVNLEAA